MSNPKSNLIASLERLVGIQTELDELELHLENTEASYAQAKEALVEAFKAASRGQSELKVRLDGYIVEIQAKDRVFVERDDALTVEQLGV